MDSYKEIIYGWIEAYMRGMGLILYGKSSPSPPPPPDPAVVANAQSGANQKTALFQAGLNNPNIYTPLGSSVYTPANAAAQAGNYPQFNQNINLSPQGQQLYGQQLQQQLGTSAVANQLLPQVGAGMGGQLPTSQNISDLNKQASDAYYQKQTAYLDPQWKNAQDQQNARLANQGVMAGSQAYNQAQQELNRSKTFAYDQAQQNAILTGPQNAGQNLQLLSAQRSLPLNELSALMSNSQVQMPQFSQYSPAPVAPTPYGQYAYGSYAGQQDIYNQQVGSNNAATGGLYGLAGSGLAAYGAYAGLAAL